MLMIGYGILAQVVRKDGKKPKTPAQNWAELFRELVARYSGDPGKEKALKDFLDQRAFNKIGEEIVQGQVSIQKLKAVIAEMLLCAEQQIIDIHNTHNLELHYSLAQMPFVGTITTTYDIFMDKAYIFKKGDVIKLFYFNDVPKASKYLEKAQKNPGLFPFVMKLHGDTAPRKEIVLNDLDLRKYLTAEREIVWKDFFRESSVLFLGFEPDTPDLECLEYLFERQIFSSLFDHWIALPFSEASQEFFNQKLKGKCQGLHAIYYGGTGLQGFLKHLQDYESDPQEAILVIVEEISSLPSPGTKALPGPQPVLRLPQPVAKEIFVLHALEDAKWKSELEDRLAAVDWPHTIDIWDIEKIEPGADDEQIITYHLNTASVFLLLISPDLLIREKQTPRIRHIMDRYKEGNVLVIPILVRQIASREMKTALFSSLHFLPPGKKALSERSDKDKAYSEIIDGIDSAIYPKSSP